MHKSMKKKINAIFSWTEPSQCSLRIARIGRYCCMELSVARSTRQHARMLVLSPLGYGKGWNRGRRPCWLSGDIARVSCLTGGWLSSDSSIKHNTAHPPRTNIGGP